MPNNLSTLEMMPNKLLTYNELLKNLLIFISLERKLIYVEYYTLYINVTLKINYRNNQGCGFHRLEEQCHEIFDPFWVKKTLPGSQMNGQKWFPRNFWFS